MFLGIMDPMFLKRKLTIFLGIFVIVAGFLYFARNKLVYFSRNKSVSNVINDLTDNPNLNLENEGGLENAQHPLSIEALRRGEYPGSDIVVEQTLESGSNYKRYIVSYKSEGLKIYGLFTVPNGNRPENGWPVIIFNHGYIPPAHYKTTERYIAYVDSFARNGYIVFKPDYRGHGNSEGDASGGYGSNAYTIDVLNAVASIKKLKDPSSTPFGRSGSIVDADRIGMWGHSMGGSITLKAMVTTKDIKAGVIWAGVVGSYQDLLENWRRRRPTLAVTSFPQARRWRQELVERYGEPSENPEFWASISATSFLSDISGPLQLHHAPSDTHVPYEFSQSLEKLMKEAEKEVELYAYEGDDHNLSKNFSLAIKRSVEFFDKNLKGGD